MKAFSTGSHCALKLIIGSPVIDAPSLCLMTIWARSKSGGGLLQRVCLFVYMSSTCRSRIRSDDEAAFSEEPLRAVIANIKICCPPLCVRRFSSLKFWRPRISEESFNLKLMHQARLETNGQRLLGSSPKTSSQLCSPLQENIQSAHLRFSRHFPQAIILRTNPEGHSRDTFLKVLGFNALAPRSTWPSSQGFV